ncbi:NADH-quinone oxidoreductase subunit B family protein [Ferviditalea candida]|uniref:NADH-quinone oxidoreductase subunit B family protein n=1 Tax=Ferviditalea candida TaxID=3108399 RepID=A0ABU5ZJ24_9BACL|nr:NADH-quinone oxidoreductase subunit B family protein [Paenibacillaceae bacterium T2]
MAIFNMVSKILRTGIVTAKRPVAAFPRSREKNPQEPPTDHRGEELRKRIKEVLGGSLHIRHLDSGSCNGCDWEMNALLNPVYDLQRFGVDFVASPRHADLLMVTGGITRNLAEAVEKTWAAIATPKMIIAVGECAINGGVFGESYAHYGGVKKLVPVSVSIPGCPPRPQTLIEGILLALDRLEQYQRKVSER